MYLVPQLRGDEKLYYLRKSRADDQLATIEEVLSRHEQLLDDWIERNQQEGGVVPEANRFREVVSGETIASRPMMRELLRRIESPRVKAVVCIEPSRLSRGSLKEIGHIVEVFRYTQTLVITLQYTYDLTDDRDRELFERELMRGNEYLEYTKKILANGKLLQLKNGWYIATHAPYGYRKISVKENRRTCHTLDPIPEEAAVVKRIFELYRDGVGAVRICDILDKECVKPPKGKKWAPGSIATIINNEHHLGKVRWNYRPTSRKIEDGEVKKQRLTADEYLVFDGKHPAIIDQELWDAVQTRRGSFPRNKKGLEVKNPLAGILRCACGRAMTYKSLVKNGKKMAKPRFVCGDARGCGQGSVLVSELINEVAKVMEECVENFEVQVEQGVDNRAELHKQLMARLEKRLAELRELEIRQWDEKTKGGMPDHVFARLNAQTIAEIEEVSQALCEAEGAAPQHVDLREKIVTFQEALAVLKDPAAPAKEKNILLKACIECINYTRPKLDKGRNSENNPPFQLEFKLRI